MTPVDLEAVQGNVLAGFNTAHQVFLGLRLDEGADLAPVREMMALLAGQVTSHAEVWRDRKVMKDPVECIGRSWLCVGLGQALLKRLRPDVTFFSKSFRNGYAARRFLLQDLSQPDSWRFGGAAATRLDMLFIVAGNDRGSTQEAAARHLARAQEAGFARLWQEEGARIPGDKEHFGFRDGIAQPRPALGHGDDPEDAQAPGQFILGYENALGEAPPALASGTRLFSDAGSFMQLRRLIQKPDAFHGFCQDTAAQLAPDWPGLTAEQVAAIIVGRWPDGTLVDTNNDGLMAALDGLDAFDFSVAAQAGGCPTGAHIRKTNPRRGPSDQAVPAHQRFLRRGIPFDNGPDDRGLLFVAFQSDPEMQVDFVTANWMNSESCPGRGHDLLVGTTPGPRSIDVSRNGTSIRIEGGDNEWIIPDGGAYLFAPSIPAIAALDSAPGAVKGFMSSMAGRVRSGLFDLTRSARRR
ncbi:Dyp-type peroxidase [Tropicibacter oceani]|uniref:Dyp-type peroxidase n=1 Tax=Tropicibacter oceani TaxID=3058420 RepID=A0ABY8QF49_9RHOB|nr:Dyp-type peroxidase [Tropicibacter oceani]WGW02412.1 Dyp-type peroxidase [Tropicibacter oceani]